jgi:hypothetical protein
MCKEKATHLLMSPDGPVPGGNVCLHHGQEIIDEYLFVGAGWWWLEPIDEYGRALSIKRRKNHG